MREEPIYYNVEIVLTGDANVDAIHFCIKALEVKTLLSNDDIDKEAVVKFLYSRYCKNEK